MGKIIPKNYYLNPDVLFLAKDLLGKVLCTNFNGEHCDAVIVETEAYKAPEDKASHAYQNLRTKRTETMFQEGGLAYVYLCYGIHSMLNVVTGPENMAHAVLIRAVEPHTNIDIMKVRVRTKKKEELLGSGPGNVCKSMGINTSLNAEKLFLKANIWIEESKETIMHSNIISSPRVGIAYAEEWAHKDWRFYFENHHSTSKPLIVKYDN